MGRQLKPGMLYAKKGSDFWDQMIISTCVLNVFQDSFCKFIGTSRRPLDTLLNLSKMLWHWEESTELWPLICAELQTLTETLIWSYVQTYIWQTTYVPSKKLPQTRSVCTDTIMSVDHMGSIEGPTHSISYDGIDLHELGLCNFVNFILMFWSDSIWTCDICLIRAPVVLPSQCKALQAVNGKKLPNMFLLRSKELLVVLKQQPKSMQ